MHGLKEQLQLSPEEAAPLLDKRGDAFAEFVAKLHRKGAIACYMHIICFIPVVPGVSSMVLQVIPAQHGKAIVEVNGAVKRIVRIMQQGGFEILGICTGWGQHAREEYTRALQGRSGRSILRSFNVDPASRARLASRARSGHTGLRVFRYLTIRARLSCATYWPRLSRWWFWRGACSALTPSW